MCANPSNIHITATVYFVRQSMQVITCYTIDLFKTRTIKVAGNVIKTQSRTCTLCSSTHTAGVSKYNKWRQKLTKQANKERQKAIQTEQKTNSQTKQYKKSKHSDDSHSSAKPKTSCSLCLLGRVYTLHALAGQPMKRPPAGHCPDVNCPLYTHIVLESIPQPHCPPFYMEN